MTSINRFLTSQAKYFSECLNARVEFEKSVIWGDTETGLDHNFEAYQGAKCAGYKAFRMGISYFKVPELFQRNNYLTDWWKEGWDDAEEMKSMDQCHGCNDGTGNPCHTHG